jgi:histidine triad (HIT) family protein
MNPDCLFCKIAAGTIPAKRVFEDEVCVAFADIHPQAPTHLLVIPKRHIASQDHAEAADTPLLGHLLATAAKVAERAGLARGYRVVINTGPDGGQTVDHLHLHLLGGRAMHWPPG